MLEDKDIQKMKDVFPTKEDLEMAFSQYTAKEMEIFATKEDLKKLSTKEDLETTSVNLLNEISANRKDLGKFKQEVREEFSKLYSAIDGYAKKSRYLLSRNGNAFA